MSSDEMGSNNEGFDENTEIWSMGDMSCGTNIEDLWDEDMWQTSEKKPKKKIWAFESMEFWSIDDDDDADDDAEIKAYEIEWDEKMVEIVGQDSDDDVDSLCVNTGTLEELWEDDDITLDEEKTAKYEKIIADYLDSVEIIS